MKIVELTFKQFDDFAKFHPLNSYCQNSKYAQVMTEYDYSYDYIGLIDDENQIKAASMILTKKVAGKVKYGYAPKGFLINYYDNQLLKEFLEELKRFYNDRDFIFIKFNPEIITGETTKEQGYNINYNGNVRIIDDLKNFDVKRRLETQEFELMQPRYNAYVNLKKYDKNNLGINYRKKLKDLEEKGFFFQIGNSHDVEKYYEMIKDNTKKPLNYYRNFYNIYSKDNTVELLFLKLNTEKYLHYVKHKYELEQSRNEHLNLLIQKKPKQELIKNKMLSDKLLDAHKEKVQFATNLLKKTSEIVMGGAFLVMHYNRVIVLSSTYNNEYKMLKPNHALYHLIFERYKPYFNYCDIGGVTGTFDETSKYHGLNNFKLGWKPTIYEFAGEFDLVCSDKIFKSLINTSFIEDEFKKQDY